MTEIHCNLHYKSYQVKKVVKELSEAPRSASYWATAYGREQVFNIYRTPAGVLYAKVDNLNY